jgi:hypothetical protein
VFVRRRRSVAYVPVFYVTLFGVASIGAIDQLVHHPRPGLIVGTLAAVGALVFVLSLIRVIHVGSEDLTIRALYGVRATFPRHWGAVAKAADESRSNWQVLVRSSGMSEYAGWCWTRAGAMRGAKAINALLAIDMPEARVR